METFSALLALYEGNSPVTGEFLSQRPVTRSFDVSLDLRLNKRLSKAISRWFETRSRSLWRYWRDLTFYCIATHMQYSTILNINRRYRYHKIILTLLLHFHRVQVVIYIREYKDLPRICGAAIITPAMTPRWYTLFYQRCYSMYQRD